MNNSHSLRYSQCSRVLLVLACALGLTMMSVPVLNAADAAILQPVADKAPARPLPLTATFEKVTGTESAPFVLKLKNNSQEALKVSGRVLLSVVHHAMDKARPIPEQSVEAGQIMTIKDLSSDDKVVLTAPDFAQLELTVPYKI